MTTEAGADEPFQEIVFFCISRENPIRQELIRFVSWKWFDRLSLIMIVVNCIGLAMNDPCDTGCEKQLCQTLQIIEYIITTFFVIEMFIKMAALGIFGRNAYFGDTWNAFDFFIVAISMTEIIFADLEINFSAIRTFRVLRPLRAINRIPSLRLLVSLVIDILPVMGNVLIFCMFIFFVFGLTSVQLWAGILRQRCFLPKQMSDNFPEIPTFMPKYYQHPEQEFICSTSAGELECSDIPYFEQRNSMCSHLFSGNDEKQSSCRNWVGNYTECRPEGPNPLMGTVNFDNLGFAWMVIFQIISLEGWTVIMYYVQDAFSFWSWIFFLALVLIGGYLAVNLCLVVIATQFIETKANEARKQELEDDGATSSSDADGMYSQLIDIIFDTCYAGKAIIKEKLMGKRQRSLRLSIMTAEILTSKELCTKDCDACQHRLSLIRQGKAGSWMKKVQCPGCKFEPKTPGNSIVRTRPNVIRLAFSISMMRERLRQILEHNITVAAVMSIIVLNAAVMALEHRNQPEQLTNFIETTNLAFTWIFVAELVIKLLAYGFKDFIRQSFNMLDTVVITLNLVELFSSDTGSNGYAVLRLFRLVRIVKIFRFLPALQKQLLVMIAVIDQVTSFFMLLAFFIFLEAILGMSLFGCKFCDNSEKVEAETVKSESSCQFKVLSFEEFEEIDQSEQQLPECSVAKFDTPFEAFFTVLQIFTQDNWNDVMRDGIHHTSHAAGIYFVLLVTFGNYIFFNLLAAILVNGFSSNNEKLHRASVDVVGKDDNILCSLQASQFSGDKNYFESHRKLPQTTSGVGNNKSLFVFPTNSIPSISIRNFFQSILYNRIIFAAIAGSCLLITLERPSLEDTSLEKLVITVANYFFTAIFLVEALLKIIASGLIFGSEAYLKNGWNILDFFLVIISMIDISIDLSESYTSEMEFLQILKVLRSLRALRPLRIISRSQGLQIVVKTLIVSVKPIVNIIIICCFFFTIFAILGVQLFKDCYSSCLPSIRFPIVSNYTTIPTPKAASLRDYFKVKTQQDCINFGFEWKTESLNFNNLPKALMSLFVFSTLDGWAEITRNGVSCVGPGMQPVNNYNMWAYAYFIAFLLVVCVFMMNMFVGVVVNNFQDVQRQVIQSTSSIDPKSKKAKQSNTGSSSNGLPVWRHRLIAFVSHPTFEYTAVGATIVNVIMMSCEYYTMPPLLGFVITQVNQAILVLITIEMILKGVAFGIKGYISDRWNQLDAVIVIASLVGVLIENLPPELVPLNPQIVSLPRVFRIMRVLKLVKSAAGVRKLLEMVSKAVPQVFNLSMLLFLLFFVYGSLGVELYGRFKCAADDRCDGLTRHANFEHFGMALLSLFRIFTGDNWNEILKDILFLSDDSEKCNIRTQGAAVPCQVIHHIAPVYFISFVLLAQFILVNVVVAVLMGQLNDSNRDCNEAIVCRNKTDNVKAPSLFESTREPEGNLRRRISHSHSVEISRPLVKYAKPSNSSQELPAAKTLPLQWVSNLRSVRIQWRSSSSPQLKQRDFEHKYFTSKSSPSLRLPVFRKSSSPSLLTSLIYYPETAVLVERSASSVRILQELADIGNSQESTPEISFHSQSVFEESREKTQNFSTVLSSKVAKIRRRLRAIEKSDDAVSLASVSYVKKQDICDADYVNHQLAKLSTETSAGGVEVFNSSSAEEALSESEVTLQEPEKPITTDDTANSTDEASGLNDCKQKEKFFAFPNFCKIRYAIAMPAVNEGSFEYNNNTSV